MKDIPSEGCVAFFFLSSLVVTLFKYQYSQSQSLVVVGIKLHLLVMLRSVPRLGRPRREIPEVFREARIEACIVLDK